MSKRPAHRPVRRFPDAERVIVECELEKCIHCGELLVPSETWHMRKYVQTLEGVLAEKHIHSILEHKFPILW